MAHSAAAARVDTPILVYTCWMWWSAVFGEMKSWSAMTRVESPPGGKAEHLDLAVGETTGVLESADRGRILASVPGGQEHSLRDSRVESALFGQPANFAGCLLTVECRAVGPVGGQSDVDVRCSTTDRLRSPAVRTGDCARPCMGI